MAGSRALKNRIRSTKNIQQITKAMEAVSAVKMRRSEQAALTGRPYALYALDILRKVEKNLGEDIRKLSSLFSAREVKKICLVVIASDKGLAGAFNSNVLRRAAEFIKNSQKRVEIVAVGKRSGEFFARKGTTVVKSFESIGDYVSISEAKHVSEFIIQSFEAGQFDQIDIIYTNFVSALKQDVVHRPLLPLNEEVLNKVVANIVPETGKFSEIRQSNGIQNGIEYKFEPDTNTLISDLVPRLVEIEIFHSILEANASEHAARMVAMRNASDNAKEVISSLTIKYNKERQAQITKELIEITSGKEALASASE